MNPERALQVAVEAARAAGAVLREGLTRDLDITLKEGRTSLVTWADRRSQEVVVEVVRDAFPTHTVVGEEGTARGEDTENVWYIDPLDGTTNYAHGIPLFSASIALRSGDRTVCGVVYDPYHDELFAATRSGGARLNGEQLRVSTTDTLERALVVTQAQTSDPAAIGAFARLVETLMNLAGGVRNFGSPAIVLCAIAAGRLEAYCERAMHPWDISAGALILEEAGGRLTQFDGRPLHSAELTDLVASNGLVHEELLAALSAEP